MKNNNSKPARDPIAYADRNFIHIAQQFAAKAGTAFQRVPFGQHKFNFSVDSLRSLDLLLEATRAVKPNSVAVSEAILYGGAYLGEVIRRASPAGSWHWVTYEEAVKLQDFSNLKSGPGIYGMLVSRDRDFINPLTKVWKRLVIGQEDSVFAFALLIIKVNNMAPGEREAFVRAMAAAEGKGQLMDGGAS